MLVVIAIGIALVLGQLIKMNDYLMAIGTLLCFIVPDEDKKQIAEDKNESQT